MKKDSRNGYVRREVDTLSEIRFGWVLEEVEGEPLETHLVYDGMPKRYDDFGEKEITMALGDPDDEANPWRYTQPVEVFFHADGTSAPVYQGNGEGFDSQAEGFEYYGQYETSDDKPDNATPTTPVPNKINYWRGLAADAGGEDPQADMGSNPSSLSDAVGNYHYSIQGTDIADTVQIFAGADANAYAFIYVMHHENGHWQRWHSPNEQGGFGTPFSYDPKNDRDEDYVHEEFEDNLVAKNYTSDEVDEDGFHVAVDNSALRKAWDHETDPSEAEEDLGAGRCRRNEKEVRKRKRHIEANDWSDIGPNFKSEEN